MVYEWKHRTNDIFRKDKTMIVNQYFVNDEFKWKDHVLTFRCSNCLEEAYFDRAASQEEFDAFMEDFILTHSKKKCNKIQLPVPEWAFLEPLRTMDEEQLDNIIAVVEFLRVNGFVGLDGVDGVFANSKCTVTVMETNKYQVSWVDENNKGRSIDSDDLNLYWLIGALTYYNLIQKDWVPINTYYPKWYMP